MSRHTAPILRLLPWIVLSIWLWSSADSRRLRRPVGPATSNDVPASEGTPFLVKQYNILAGSMGNNWFPWFLYGADLERARWESGIVAENNTAFQDMIGSAFIAKDKYGVYLNNPKNLFDFTNQDHFKLQGQSDAINEYGNRYFGWNDFELFGVLHRGRKYRLVEEILRGEPDIIMLEELDDYKFFRDALGQNYDSKWLKRPRWISQDGCAIFWLRSRFRFDNEFAEHIFAEKRDRVALAVVLHDLATEKPPHRAEASRRVLVVNTHLARNPERPSMNATRRKQLNDLEDFVKDFISTKQLKVTSSWGSPPRDAVILGGDFNAMRENLRRTQTYTNVTEDRIVMGEHISLGTEGLMSAFPGPANTDTKDDGCTTRTRIRSSWIDYIFYSHALKLRDVYKDPCPTHGSMPDNKHPSDHLPIAAKFVWNSMMQTVHGQLEETVLPIQTMDQITK